jgi:hypothetical protein
VLHSCKVFILPRNVTRTSYIPFSSTHIALIFALYLSVVTTNTFNANHVLVYKNAHTWQRHVTEWVDILGPPLCLPPWQSALTPVLPGVELYCDWGKLQQTCLSALAEKRATCQAMHQYTNSAKNINSNIKIQDIDLANGPNFQVFMNRLWHNIQFKFRAKCMF